ncbi:T9SS type A sorting domain-containing protein [Sphingobacteriales bacterium CHB3]|nr:T9SS type A sorting domain-containing protein [Sphingobacteriales bacterium CHB3]
MLNTLADLLASKMNLVFTPILGGKTNAMVAAVSRNCPLQYYNERSYAMCSPASCVLRQPVLLRMKRFMCLLLAGGLVSSVSFSQIPNAGFELWEMDLDSNYNPVGWQTTNSYPLVNVEPYSPGCQGSFAMKVKTVNFGFPVPGVALLETGYTFTQLPTSISVCYRSTVMPGDRAYIIVGLMRGDSVVALQDSCTFKIDSTTSQFINRTFPLVISANLVPDSLIIIVASGLGFGQVGTELIVDAFAFGFGSASVPGEGSVPASFALFQNHPNPFNPSTTIDYEIPKAGKVELHIYDVLGQHVAELLSGEQTAGKHSVVWNGQNDEGSPVSGGVYFYRLSVRTPSGQVGSYTGTKKLTLLR